MMDQSREVSEASRPSNEGNVQLHQRGNGHLPSSQCPVRFIFSMRCGHGGGWSDDGGRRTHPEQEPYTTSHGEATSMNDMPDDAASSHTAIQSTTGASFTLTLHVMVWSRAEQSASRSDP